MWNNSRHFCKKTLFYSEKTVHYILFRCRWEDTVAFPVTHEFRGRINLYSLSRSGQTKLIKNLLCLAFLICTHSQRTGITSRFQTRRASASSPNPIITLRTSERRRPLEDQNEEKPIWEIPRDVLGVRPSKLPTRQLGNTIQLPRRHTISDGRIFASGAVRTFSNAIWRWLAPNRNRRPTDVRWMATLRNPTAGPRHPSGRHPEPHQTEFHRAQMLIKLYAGEM